MSKFTREEALEYHRLKGKPGKIAVVPTKPMDTARELSLAYSPGVAVPVEDIAENPENAYEYTSKGNLVAVVSNGTAILGLGNLGPLASKPVMEGKGVLFKKFADVDVFDIEVDETDVEEVIKIVKAIAPTFGGINLEDIKAPECFEIETRLKKEIDIPVFHDDQHGTAIISSAGLINALEIIGKKIEDIKVVVNGAGASAISCSKLAIRLGVKRENLIMLDSRGVLHHEREGLNKYKKEFVQETDKRTLADAMVGADVFYGLSVAGALKPEMVKEMAKDPIIFAMANPTPEIMPEEALAVRPDCVIATGRSDYPNQVNNVLGFPFIFRGALDVRATAINEEMKIAAVKAIADLAKEDVPDSVLRAYNKESMKFGREYIIPAAMDPRVLLWEAPAIAQAAMDSGVARKTIDIEKYREELAFRQGKGARMHHLIMNKAKSSGGTKRVVFEEGEEAKIIRAAFRVQDEGIGIPILLGNEERICAKVKDLALDFKPQVINPRDMDRRKKYGEAYYAMRKRKGITPTYARKIMRRSNVFAPMMIHMGEADAVVSGLTYDYPDILRPALKIHHTAEGTDHVAGLYIMIVNAKAYIFADTTVNIDPSAEDLVEIAALAAGFAKTVEIDPRVAFLSFSDFGSTDHPYAHKIAKAAKLMKEKHPDIPSEGEMQADTAVVPSLIEERFPFSEIKDANVLIFPSLDAANISYKLLARLGKAKAIGPILVGMGAPVHVLQAGDEVNDIVEIAAVAVMDAMNRN
ncbi:MAG: NADP-dependent malic enzyme [Anaerolineae bacterium]|jgi:malate dehydrogenase (oxaloacetate-decarboxylating)(NADP+)|nr:NADP-dependent malic enzyme [Anaerolineae bacterium]MBT7074538.1 NADP-dependent malic enzyme [Anaerolineae bacterium]MBT7783268.1 NADP-dependent malic enzyme [Anaerolineae bacterium]